MEDRILTYFYFECPINSKEFDLKLSYKELADYFMVDRSAFMRKLSELEKRKIIKRDGRHITIL